jgi:hypothetical protein
MLPKTEIPQFLLTDFASDPRLQNERVLKK